MKKINDVLKLLFSVFRRKKSKSSDFIHRKSNLIIQLDFLIDTLNMNKMDLMYMESLKMPLTSDQKVYFIQQIDRINSAIKILLWFRENVKLNERFWTKFFNWTRI